MKFFFYAFAGVVSGCENFVDIAEYGAEKPDIPRQLSDFRHQSPRMTPFQQ